VTKRECGQTGVSIHPNETVAPDELGAPATRSPGRSLRQGDAEAGREPVGRSVVVHSERAGPLGRDARNHAGTALGRAPAASVGTTPSAIVRGTPNILPGSRSLVPPQASSSPPGLGWITDRCASRQTPGTTRDTAGFGRRVLPLIASQVTAGPATPFCTRPTTWFFRLAASSFLMNPSPDAELGILYGRRNSHERRSHPEEEECFWQLRRSRMSIAG
jgi:hypothetical protein